MKKHKIFKFSGLWYGVCGSCTECTTGHEQPSVMLTLEWHVMKKHSLTPVPLAL